jgi:hypothetical protein
MVPTDINAAFAMYELALLANPGDTDARFAAAYAYHQHGQSAMSFFHYYESLGHKSDSAARNNAGVSARALKLPITATRLQRQAAEDGYTLAASNLAFELIGLGFTPEAEAILAKARQQQQQHERVGLAQAQITTSQNEEEESRKTLKTNFDLMSQWRQKHARGLLSKQPLDFGGTYRGGNATIRISTTETAHTVEGTIFVIGGMRRSAFSGKLDGSVLDFTWKTEKPSDGSYYYPEEGHGLMIVQPPTIVGYRQKGSNRDAFDLSSLVEFSVSKAFDDNEAGA